MEQIIINKNKYGFSVVLLSYLDLITHTINLNARFTQLFLTIIS